MDTSGEYLSPDRLVFRFHDGQARPPEGTRFALLDGAGYAGLARLGRQVDVCDDCGGPHLEATLLEGPRVRSRDGVVAFAPIQEPPMHARMKRIAVARESPHWQVDLLVDLDGDGHWDWERVVSCGERIPSRCGEGTCSAICVGIRAPGELSPKPGTVGCDRFLPDVDDCPEGAKR